MKKGNYSHKFGYHVEIINQGIKIMTGRMKCLITMVIVIMII